MLKVLEIPLSAEPQRFTVQLGATSYQLRLLWSSPAAAWMMDLLLEDGTQLLGGVPLVTGRDLLEPYPYLGIPGCLIVQTDHQADAVPTFENLGVAGRLYYVAEAS